MTFSTTHFQQPVTLLLYDLNYINAMYHTIGNNILPVTHQYIAKGNNFSSTHQYIAKGNKFSTTHQYIAKSNNFSATQQYIVENSNMATEIF